MIKLNKKSLTEDEKQEYILENEHKVFNKVYFKYLLLKIRAKISFIAFQKRMTISELFVRTILKCYTKLQDDGFYPVRTAEQQKTDSALINFLTEGEMHGFMRKIAIYNLDEAYNKMDATTRKYDDISRKKILMIQEKER